MNCSSRSVLCGLEALRRLVRCATHLLETASTGFVAPTIICVIATYPQWPGLAVAVTPIGKYDRRSRLTRRGNCPPASPADNKNVRGRGLLSGDA